MSLTKLERSLSNVNPSLISKKIKKIISDHINYKNSIGISEGEITELEELLLSNPSINFMDFVWDNDFESLFPFCSKDVKENANIIRYVLGKNPRLISSIPVDVVTSEHALIYERFLKENPTESYSFRKNIPSSLIENEYVINRIIDVTISNATKDGAKNELAIHNFQDLLNILVNREDYIKRMVPYIKELGLFEDRMFNNFNDDLLLSPSFVKETILSNRDLYFATLKYRAVINDVLADIIRTTDFDVSKYLQSFSSVSIVDALMSKSDITGFNFRYMNIDNFSVDQIVRILNEVGTYGAPINYVSRADVLREFIKNNDYRFLIEFREAAFTTENLIDLINVSERLNEYEIETLVKNLGKNSVAAIKFLEKVKTEVLTGNMEFALVKQLDRLDPSLFSNEHYEIINDIYLSGEYGKELIKSNYRIYDSSDFMKYVLLRDSYDQYSGFFSKMAYNKENFYILYEKYGLKRAVKEVNNPTFIAHFISEFPFETEEQITNYFEELNNMYSPSLALFFIRNTKKSGITSEKIESYINYYEIRLINELVTKINDEELVNSFINKVYSGERSPFTLDYIDNLKALKIASYFSDISSLEEKERLVEIPDYFIDKINKKHIQQIISMLKDKGCSGMELTLLAMKMLSNIELQRCRDLLNPDLSKNYGDVSLYHVRILFNNFSLYDTEFREDGKNFLPVYNDELIRVFFGENYKIKNTPIRNYLSSYSEKKAEHLVLEDKIITDSTLTPQQKRAKLDELNEAFKDYQFCVSNFVQTRHMCHSKWFSIKEEFLKQQNKSKLKLKLNLAKIEELSKIVSHQMPELDIRDNALINSDVFDYVGIDNQYTTHPEKARARAVELSRKMETQTKKKFPNITKSKGNLTLRVFNPQDRRILSVGYKTNCCFRPNGSADNDGMNNSLLNYCVSTEYGGGLEIVDEKGNVIMFSPLLRNGNVLMIHSIETTYNENLEIMHDVHELLKEFSVSCIEAAKENGDELDFVTITNLHYLNPKYTEGYLPKSCEFKVLDVSNQFEGMYNNLDNGHAVLSHREGKTFSDIKYGEVGVSYDYNAFITKYIGHVEYTEEEIRNIEFMMNLKEEIIKLSNERYIAVKNNDSSLNLILISLINSKKKEYLDLYKKMLDSKKGVDICSEYHKITRLITYIDEQTHTLSRFDIGNIMYGDDWYINISPNGILNYNALPNATQEMMERLEMLKKLNGFSIYEHTVIHSDEENKGFSM